MDHAVILTTLIQLVVAAPSAGAAEIRVPPARILDRLGRHGRLWAQDGLTYFRASTVDWT